MKFKFSILVVSIIFTATSVFAEEINLPDIDEVQKVALDYARIRPDELSNMRKNARRARMLPKFQVGLTRAFQNNIDIAINDSVSVTSSGTNIGPEASNIKQNQDNNTAVEVKAVWALDELIFNRDLLDISEEARYQMRERRQLITEINKLYFELKRIYQDPDMKFKRDEIIADLDAFTGGWFSNQMRE